VAPQCGLYQHHINGHLPNTWISGRTEAASLLQFWCFAGSARLIQHTLCIIMHCATSQHVSCSCPAFPFIIQIKHHAHPAQLLVSLWQYVGAQLQIAVAVAVA